MILEVRICLLFCSGFPRIDPLFWGSTAIGYASPPTTYTSMNTSYGSDSGAPSIQTVNGVQAMRV